MKKIIILIAILCGFGFCKGKDTIIDGLVVTIVYDTECDYPDSEIGCGSEVQIWGGAFMSCGQKISNQKYYDFEYNRNTEELTVWRPCEGTLLFKGRVITSNDEGIEVDGYCYDKNGLKETKHVNRITKCK